MSVNATQTITTMGWTKRSPTYLYTILPVTFIALLTYTAIGYALWQMSAGQISGTTFDPTNPIHLVMASSTRVPARTEERCLAGESIGIRMNEDLQVELHDVVGVDGVVRKGFKLLDSMW